MSSKKKIMESVENTDSIKEEVKKIREEMKDPSNWKRNENYFNLLHIGLKEDSGMEE